MFKNIGSNWVLNILTAVVTFYVTPFQTLGLGGTVNGVWQTIVAATGYLALLLTGVPMASVRELSERLTTWEQAKRSGDEAQAAQRLNAVNATITNCLGLYLRLGAAAVIVGGAIFAWWEWQYVASGKVPAGVVQGARIAFAISVAQLAGGFVSQVPIAILAAHREFVLRNLVAVGSLVLRVILVYSVFKLAPSLVTLASIQVALLVCDFTASSWIIRKKFPELHLRLHGFDRQGVRQMLSFSVFVLLLNVGNKIAFQTDELVIGKFLTMNDVTTFQYGKQLVLQFSDFIFSIGIVLNPTATRLKTQGNLPELAQVFLKWSKIGLSLTLLGGIYLLILGQDFLRAWLYDPKFAFDAAGAGQIQTVFMLSHFAFLPARGIVMPILMGLGHAARPTIAFLTCAVANLILSLVLVKPLGLLGVALGTAIPDVLFAAFLFREIFRTIDLRPSTWAAYVLPKVLLGCVPVAGALWLMRGFATGARLPVLVALGVIHVLIFGVVWVFFVFRGDSHFDPWRKIRSRGRPSTP